MADQNVKDFLTAWNLQQYITKLTDIKTLLFLKEENMIKELIPSVGHRAHFISNLEDWRAIISGMPNTSSVSNIVTDSQTSSSSLASSTVTVEDNCSFQTIGNSGLSQILSPQSFEDNTFSNIELLDLLKSANAGKALLATYSQSGLLDSIGRKRLFNIIINKELQDDVNRLKRAVKGKLLDCLYNKRRDYHKSGLISPSRNSTSSSSAHSSPILLPESLRSLDDKTENNEALI
ncbi:hypothetical protein QTP88_012051 [Uroleucon formosanum]